MALFSTSEQSIPQVIHTRRDSVVSTWLARIRAEIPSTEGYDDRTLIDGVPEFIDSVGFALAAPNDPEILRVTRKKARAHGAQRASTRYFVTHVISDYICLRESLIAVIGGEPSTAELLALSRIFEAAIGAAVEEFTATHQLTSASENLKSIADAVPTIVARIDREFRYEFVNHAYEEWSGRSSSQVLGRTVSEVVEPETAAALSEIMSRALAGEKLAFEHPMKGADGRVEHMLFSFVPAHDRAGNVNGLIVTGQSIEQQKRAELEAKERKNELANVFAQAPTPIALLSGPDHVFTLANPPYIEFFGKNPTGHKARSVFSDPEMIERLDHVYQTGVPYFGRELSFKRTTKDGEVVEQLINLAYHPYRSTTGSIAGLIVFVYDVTDQVRARAAIEQNETRLRAIFAHASVGFAVSDLEGRFLEVNPRFCEMIGYSAEELKGRLVVSIVHPDDLAMDRRKLGELTSGEVNSFVIEKRFIRKDGSTLWVRNSVSLVKNPAGDDPLIFRVAEDVTALRESERRLRMLADSMPQIVWTATPEGFIDYFNQVWYDYADINPSDSPTDQWNSVAHKDDLQPAIEKWARCLETGGIFETRVRLRSKNGEYRWFMARGRPVYDASGKIERWYGTNTDVNEQEVLNTQLLDSQRAFEDERQKFTTLVKDASTSIAVLRGDDLEYEIVNPSYQNLFAGRQLVGKKLLEALPELEDQPFPRLLKAAYNGETYREIEAHARLRRTPDGPIEDSYFDQSYTQIRDQEGKPYGVFIHAVEVTEKVRARRQLEEIAQRLQVATLAADMGTWDVVPSTGELSWSARANELFGLPPNANLPLERALDRVHTEDRARLEAAISKAIDPQQTPDFAQEYRVQQTDGSYRWISAVGRATRGTDANGQLVTTRFSGIVWDITDRVLADAAMRDAKERAELANAAKSSFLANMSHEIRTPLGAIMGFVSLIKDEGLSPQAVNNYIAVIERNSTQLMRIIDDILDLSKVEAGMMVIEHIDFSLVELLSDFASLMGFRAREKGVNFELKALTELPDVITSDPTRMRQILTNIVGNAIKFTDAGNVSLRVSFEKDELKFDVVDTGRGISADQAEKLFQPFSQGDASTTRKYGGTGLGLALTRRLSEALGGKFELVKSQPGVGSTFTSRIRVKLPERSKLVRALGFASETIRNAGVQGQLRDLRVLLVEDSPDNQALFSIYLNRAGAKIDIAPDGQRGVEMALADSYDVVLMDVQMPIMDGITAVRKLRSSGYETPIIALTAHAMKEEKIRCLEAGYTSFLSKPIQRAELVEALKGYRPQ